jgi:hypothetical protein
MGEIRVFYKDRFLGPAVSAELAGETIPLRDIIRVRNQRRRRELSSVLYDRQKVVDSLLELKKCPQKPSSYPYPESASKVPQRVAALLSKQSNTAGSLNYAMPAASSVTSAFVTDRPALGKLSQPCDTVARTRSFRVIVGQAK